MAGYSGTPLPRKLGIKEGYRVALVRAPEGFDRGIVDMPDRVTMRSEARGTNDVMVFFATRRAELERRFSKLAGRLDPGGGLWIAWPKRTSRVATDLSEQVVRDIGLSSGLVDNKVCAVDEIWSALRFVYRVEDRPGLAAAPNLAGSARSSAAKRSRNAGRLRSAERSKSAKKPNR